MKQIAIVLGLVCFVQAIVISWLLLPKPVAVTPTTPPVPASATISGAEQFRNKWISDKKEEIEQQAKESLASWLEQNPIDGSQIEGAKLETVDWVGPWIYVRMHKDNQKAPDTHMHDAYFHILFDTSLAVVYQQRGPDEIE
jgi:hypothetical protein